MLSLKALTILLLLSVQARAEQPIDCETVRAMVAEHGKAKALAWAIERGYSWRQINLARKCLK